MPTRDTKRSTPFTALVLLLAVFYGPMLVRGEVIYPHDNSLALGARATADDDEVDNRKFSDQSSVFVPEIQHHIHGDHRSWLSTWNPHVELGRPSIQLSGFSPAFVLTRALMLCTDNAFVVYTWLTVASVVLLAVFAFLFFEALGLHPWACFAGSAGLSMGVFVSYWLTFVMFVSGLCWTMAVLWSVTRFLERRSFFHGACIVLAVHALCMTAYPQQAVWHAYLVIAFVLWRIWTSMRDARPRASALGWLAALALLGLASAAPALADLALQASRSARLTTDREFFLKSLREIASLSDLWTYLGQLFDAFWLGNPIRREYPIAFNGVCLTPLVVVLAPLCLVDSGWRRAWPWAAFVTLCFVVSIWPAAYLFGVDHLGLSFSRFSPMAAALIPVAVCAALAIDRVLTHGFTRPWLVIVVTLAVVLPAVLALRASGKEVAWTYVAIAGLIMGLVLALTWTRAVVLLVAAVVASALHYGERLVLARPLKSILTTSPLVERIRAATDPDTRFAFVGMQSPRMLPANIECLLGLRSIHSYNSLSSRDYQRWSLEISDQGTMVAGRYFPRLASDARLDSAVTSYAGIGAVVGLAPIQATRFERAAPGERPFVQRARARPSLFAQVADFELAGEAAVSLTGALDSHTVLESERLERHDDYVRFRITASERPTLLFVSQQHHPHWEARSGGAKLETAAVNGFYQGVLVPPNTSEIEIEFRPWVRWMWVVHALIATTALAWLCMGVRRRFARG